MKNLAIFYGGKSVEHDISIITAIQVMNNLDKRKYNIVPIYVDENNAWHIIRDHLNMNIYAEKNLKGKRLVSGFFNCWLICKGKFGFKRYKKIDVAINCMHGLNGEDGTLSGLLELSNIPYVGSGVVSSGVGMDKVLQKDIFMANNIPCAKYVFFTEKEYLDNEEKTIKKIEEKISYPMVIKPANLGSSIGINISKNKEELIKNIEIALVFDKKIIIEEKIPNLREINCSVVGNYDSQETSMLEEPKNWKLFLDFEEKYISGNKGQDKKDIGVVLGDGLDERVKALSKKVFSILGCSGVVRIDFLLNGETGELFVNEINTIPGSYANYLWNHKYTFSELLEKLIDLAIDEYIYKNTNTYTFSSNVLKNNSNNKNLKNGTKF